MITKISDAPLSPDDNSEYCSGDTININNSPCILGDVLGHGGEGTVFEIEGKKEVAKLYHKYSINLRQIEKLKIIVAANLRSESIAAPISLVFDSENRNVIGFTMEYVVGRKLDEVLIDDGKLYNKREIVLLCYNIVRAYHELDTKAPTHKILAGDINTNNVIVYDKTKVKLIDIDSIQIDDYPCPVGFAGFNHPSSIGKNYREYLRNEANEQFALAVLLFMVLINKHPYAQTNGEDDDSNVLNLPFRYQRDEKKIQNIPSRQYVFRWSTLTPELQQLFIDTFTTAKTSLPIITTFEQWEIELRDYYATLEKRIQEYRMLDIWLLTMDPFSEAKVCSYCGNAFTPTSEAQKLCPRCSKLNLSERQCANPFCATPGRIYYIPVAMSRHILYCSDCLQPYVSNCKRCGQKIPVKKHEIHTFNGLYCDVHRPPAKGRLTKANNAIDIQIRSIEGMFKSKKYAQYTVEFALKEFKHILNVLLKDDDIIEVIPTINKVKGLIREFELYKNDYYSFFKTLKDSTVPKSSDEKKNTLRALKDTLSSFENLSKKWQNTVIPFKNSLGYSYLASFYKEKINEIDKINFKKCACCGKEERNDYWTYTGEYYCPECLREYIYTCRHCKAAYRKPKYLHDKEDLGTLCESCTNEVTQISQALKNTTASNFENMGSFENLNFVSRREKFNKIFEAISNKVKSYEDNGFKFRAFDSLKREAELVRYEETYLEKYRLLLKENASDSLEKASYASLKLLLDKLSSAKHELNSTTIISQADSLAIADLAPVPLALKSINDKENLINQLITKKLSRLKEALLAFSVFKASLSHFDGYNIDWVKRTSTIKTTVSKYLPIFEEYSFDIQEAQNERDYINNELPSLTDNEQNFFKGSLQFFAYIDGAQYTTSNSSDIDKAINEIKWHQDFLNKRGTRFILYKCVMEKSEKTKNRLELMKSILDNSFFNDVKAYITDPIRNWKNTTILSLTTERIINKRIPDDFKAIVENQYKRIMAVKDEYYAIGRDIKAYSDDISKSFRTSYKAEYLRDEIPSRIHSLSNSGYDISGLDTLLTEEKKFENALKEKYIDDLNNKAVSWKNKLSNYLILLFANLSIIGESASDYYLSDTRTYENFLLYSIISGILSLYAIIAFFAFYRKKGETSNCINCAIISSGTLTNWGLFFFVDAIFGIGLLKLLITGVICCILAYLVKKPLTSLLKYNLDSIDANITKKQRL